MFSSNELKNINMPARYIGEEAGVVKKKNCICKTALLLPYVYEQASLDITLRHMYYNINKKREISLERCFAVMPDFESWLKEKNKWLCTLDTKTPLKDMDILFVKLQSPLEYTTFLHMLRLGGVERQKSARGTSPIVIVGGDSVLSPAVLSKIADVCVIGDMTRISEQIIDKFVLCKKEGKDKTEFLKSLLRIEGVYVPEYHNDEKIEMVVPKRLDDVVMPKYQLIHHITSPMDAVAINISSKCDKKCTMCPYKNVYSRVQDKSVENAVKDAVTGIKATGNTHIAIYSNCFCDTSDIIELIYRLKDIQSPKVKKISFANVTLNKENLWLIPYLKEQYKRTGELPTIVVGATSDRLRKVLGIEINDDDILDIARKLFRADFTKVRLKYFLGTPTETYEDLSNIFELVSKINKIYFEEYSKLPNKYIVQLDICGFYALPYTPMQFAKVNEHTKLQLKEKYIKEKANVEFVEVVFENFVKTEVLTMLARGDERFSDVLCEAENLGANFEYIEKYFNEEIWQIALNKFGINVKDELAEKKATDSLPWDNIVAAVSKEELAKEYEKQVKNYEDSSNK